MTLPAQQQQQQQQPAGQPVDGRRLGSSDECTQALSFSPEMTRLVTKKCCNAQVSAAAPHTAQLLNHMATEASTWMIMLFDSIVQLYTQTADAVCNEGTSMQQLTMRHTCSAP
jgi:hypothetical protein